MHRERRVGLIGCGSIGGSLAKAIDDDTVPNTRLTCVFDKNIETAKKFAKDLKKKPKVAESFKDFLKEDLDVVVEAASQEAVRVYILKILKKGVDVVVMSGGALLDSEVWEHVNKISKKIGNTVYIPSGAVCGLDGVKAASVGKVDEVVLTTRKPPSALKGAEYITKGEIDLNSMTIPTTIYEGIAEEVVNLFPQNVNVCAALSLAGIGPKKTKVSVIVDPSLRSNVHEIYVKGEFGELRIEVRNVPSPKNPKTSYLACLSAIKTLKELSGGIRIGT